jgi:hypothetical protein
MYCIEKLNNGQHPSIRKRLSVKYGFKCAEQPLGSLHCGYYVCKHLRTCGQYKINHENVSHHCLMYLYFLSPFFHCLINSFLLHQYPNYREEWDYAFTHDIQKGEVDNIISDICRFLRREIFYVDDSFFDKTKTLAEFLQLCNFVIMKDLLCKQLMYLGVFDYMKMCTYNEFEYCKVFDYYLNVYMWILLCEFESYLNLKYSNIVVICIFQMVSAGLKFIFSVSW